MNNRSLDNLYLFKGVSWMVVYICEAVLILTGNSITVYIFWSIRKRLKRTSYLLINHAVADILVGISITLFLLYHILSTEEVRKMATVAGVVGTLSSLLSMALISLERMCAILWPFRHRILNILYYHISVGIVWFMACSIATVNVSIDLYNIRSSFKFLTAIAIFCSVAVIGGAYLAIWISTRRNLMSGKTGRSTEQDRKLAKTLFLVTALSIVMFLPIGIHHVFSSYLEHKHSFWVQITIVVQQSNSFLNPFVYRFKMPEFKESLHKLLCCCSRQRLPRLQGNTGEVTLRSLKIVDTL